MGNVGPAPNYPNLTPSRHPKQHSKLVVQNETQFGDQNASTPNKQENHTYINLKENIAAA